jgi:hypothetical protein
MEMLLCRKLESWEVVHHIDGNHDNNSLYPMNLEIKEFGKHSHDHLLSNQFAFGKHYNTGNRYKLGRTLSEESKMKIGQTKLGNKNMLGKRHSDETKERLRQARLGTHASEETKQKMSQTRLGKRPVNGRLV